MTTKEQLTEIVDRVREATDSLRGDEDVRRIAFKHLLEHELAVAQPVNGQESNSANHHVASSSEKSPLDDAYATPEMRAEAVARYFQISQDAAQDLFDLRGEAPVLSVSAKKLDASKAGAVRQIALLVGGSRTALGLDTGTAHIRETAESYGKLDSNFMSTLTDFEQIAVRGKPSSKNRLVRMRVIGAEASRELAKRLMPNGE